MKGTIKAQLLKELHGGLHMSRFRLALRGTEYDWIQQDILMLVC